MKMLAIITFEGVLIDEAGRAIMGAKDKLKALEAEGWQLCYLVNRPVNLSNPTGGEGAVVWKPEVASAVPDRTWKAIAIHSIFQFAVTNGLKELLIIEPDAETHLAIQKGIILSDVAYFHACYSLEGALNKSAMWKYARQGR
jgi:hypothetical protein